MSASFAFHNAVCSLAALAGFVCDELATTIGIHLKAGRHKEFGDVSRHNLLLNEMARHSGAGVGSSEETPQGFVSGLPVARLTAGN